MRDLTVIEVFADVVCPFAHVGLRAVARRRDELGRDDVRLRIRAWPLELVNGAPLDAHHTAGHVAVLRAEVAPEMFAGFDPERFPATSLPALALVASAYRISDIAGEAVSFAIRDALFEEGRDVSAPEVLAAVAEAFDLSVQDERASADVVADWHEGQARGVKGSPHFFCGANQVFCPSLRISRSAGHMHVTPTAEPLDRFVRGCLEAA
jgi:predicted DsbA family dithiol-disulfide isomerase